MSEHRESKEEPQPPSGGEQESKHATWLRLGMMSMVGWSIVLPPVAGALLGSWIDANWPSPVPWTPILLFGGLLVGCLSVWRWMQYALRENHPAATLPVPSRRWRELAGKVASLPASSEHIHMLLRRALAEYLLAHPTTTREQMLQALDGLRDEVLRTSLRDTAGQSSHRAE
jgi:predicted F0F1-ATPase subunit